MTATATPASRDALEAWAREWAARPLLRGWLHAAALPLAVGGFSLLTARRPRFRRRVAAHGVGISLMLGTSAAYHRLTRTRRQFEVGQALDHAMIFAAIAGTATPVALAVLPPRLARPGVAGLWAAAAAGAVGRVRGLRRGTSGGSAAYLVLGWAGAALLPGVVRTAGARVGGLLALGGLAYTVGAAGFATRWPDPSPRVFGYHEVWHLATLVGAGAHLAAVAELTRTAD